MTRTTREIIKNAKFLANATNSDFTDFYVNTVLLNNVYRDIYTDIVLHSAEFIETIETGDSMIELPEDCFQLVSVEFKNGATIERSPIRHRVNSNYYVENNVLYMPAGNKVIKYSKLPVTLTAPDKSTELTDFTPPEIGTNYRVNEDGTLSEESNDSKYLNKDFTFDLENQTFTWNDEDVSAYFVKENNKVVNVVYDSPYMAVSYEDGTIVIMDSFAGTEYNYNCIFGHDTKGIVYAMTTDDTTGKGIIWKDNRDGKYYYSSFVPDTVLNYPNNALFSLMEYKLAALLSNLLGMQSPYLENTAIPNAETQLYATISKMNNQTRVRSVI